MRFSKEEIRRVVPLLHINEIQFRNQYSVLSEKAFYILLYRLASELRWKDLCLTFGMSRSTLYSIF
jgi:AraC-like DNA-binding protein